MALETSTYIDGLVATNPTSSDNVGDGDNHIRLLKSTIKATFPNLTGAVSGTQAAINSAVTDANNATNANTASTIVKRDASGNFSAGAITASLTGDVTGNVTGNTTGTHTGNTAGTHTGNVVGNVTGNTSGTAGSWANARTITLGGDLSGNVSIDGSQNVTLTAAIVDDSHNHTIANVDGLQTALDAKLAASSYTAADVLTKIKTVDGAGSGLDADTVDGIEAASLVQDTDFTQSISANGWCKLPNGLTLQWGRTSVSGNTANASVSFPVAFSNACLQVVATQELSGVGESDNWGLGTTSPSTTAFRLTNGHGSAHNFRWIAIGH